MIVRKPQVAGAFYPRTKEEVESLVGKLLDENLPAEKFKDIFGIISPHAGYVYSGATAAFAFNTLKDRNIENAIIISPSHAEYFPGVSIYNGDAYETPLGEIPVNIEMREAFCRNSNSIFSGIEGHRREHALEVQIPFLQLITTGVKIVPIVMGDQRREFVNELAEKIAGVWNENTVVIASSDLSHFYPREEAEALDKRIEAKINLADYEGLLDDLEQRNVEACGGGPMSALLKAASLLGYDKAKVLNRTDSGFTTGDTREVVGYLSAVVFK